MSEIEPEMTVYDLLRKLIRGGAWSEEDRAAAQDLVDRLEAIGAFGTSAQETHVERRLR